MVGEERLAQDPVVNIVNTITNSPGAVQQNVVGQDNQQSVQRSPDQWAQLLQDARQAVFAWIPS
jgi:hypothetical protein